MVPGGGAAGLRAGLIIFGGHAPNRLAQIVRRCDRFGVCHLQPVARPQRERSDAGFVASICYPVCTDTGADARHASGVHALQIGGGGVGGAGIQDVFVLPTAPGAFSKTAEIEGEDGKRKPLRQRREWVGSVKIHGRRRGWDFCAAVLQPGDHAHIQPVRLVAAGPVHQDDNRGRVDCRRVVIANQRRAILGLEFDALRLCRQGGQRRLGDGGGRLGDFGHVAHRCFDPANLEVIVESQQVFCDPLWARRIACP